MKAKLRKIAQFNKGRGRFCCPRVVPSGGLGFGGLRFRARRREPAAININKL
jgi:hypothetical protein